MGFRSELRNSLLHHELAIPATLTTLGASLFDFWTHPNRIANNAHAFSYFSPARRVANPENRYALGTFIGEHIGNFGYSAAAMIPFTMASEAVRSYAQKKESKTLEKIADTIPHLGLLTIAWLNFSVENFMHNEQFWGDMSFGIGAALLAHYAMKNAIGRYQDRARSAGEARKETQVERVRAARRKIRNRN